MSFYTILLVAVALGTDAMSMALGLGLTGTKRKQAISLIAIIAIFHIVMPLIGLSLGSLLGKAIGRLASIIGALVLVFIGGHMMWESLKETKASLVPRKIVEGTREKKGFFVTSGITGLLVIAASVSLDALTVGFGLGTAMTNLWVTVLTMGIVAGIMTGIGLYFGSRLGSFLGEKAQIIGGIVLIGIGIKMFFM